MKKGSVNFIELYIDKLILGVAVCFTLYMAWAFLINSPNQISVLGDKVGPAQLDAKVLAAAEDLRSTVARGQPDESPIERYEQKLRQAQEGGIFAALDKDKPAVPRGALPRIANLGASIEVPGMKEEENAVAVALVKPLPPTRPVLMTGRSLLTPEATVISASPAAPGGSAAASATAVEKPWVSIASYFDPDKQREEMIDKAGYAPFRARVYVVGVDVQRQERLASGAFSDWQDVQSASMPEVEIPEPAFDDSTGALLNKSELDAMFGVVKAEQRRLMQPDFARVEAGDYWQTPPLEGYEESEDEEEETTRPTPPADRPTAVAPPRPPVQSPGSGNKGTITVGGPGNRTGGGGGGAAAGQSPAQQKADARKQALADLAEARRSYGKREFSGAKAAAQRVLSNTLVTPALHATAEKLIKRVERIEARQNKGQAQAPLGPRGSGVDDAPIASGIRGGGRVGAVGAVQPRQDTAPLIKHPEKNTPAVWFHDDSVESGKTYRYRMRVQLWNRYVGRMRAVQDPQMAKLSAIVGEWSLPSDEITVTPRTYFFAAGSSNEGAAANFEVWAWRSGDWLKQRFEVRVGDTIGGVKRVKTGEYDDEGKEVSEDVDFGTNAVVLDVREDTVRVRLRTGQFSERKSVVVTYVDPADGQVKQRASAIDQYDPVRKRLAELQF